MTSNEAPRMRASLHLTEQPTVTFTADRLWPLEGSYSRFGPGLEAFATEVTRRLQADGYVGFRADDDSITLIPLSAVARLDFAETD